MNFDGAKDRYIECLQEEVFRLNEALREERTQKISKKVEEKREVNPLYPSKDNQIDMLAKFLKYYIKRDLEKLVSRNPFYARSSVGSQRVKDSLDILSSEFFDLKWYISTYGLDIGDRNPIVHYLDNEKSLLFNPSCSFDVGRYAEKYPDVVESGQSLLLHYIRYGFKENRVKFKVQGKKSR